MALRLEAKNLIKCWMSFFKRGSAGTSDESRLPTFVSDPDFRSLVLYHEHRVRLGCMFGCAFLNHEHGLMSR